MTTIVSGFLTNINSYRNIEKYIEYGKKLCKININKIIFIEESIYNTYFKDEIYELTHFIFTNKEQLYLYKYNDELINFDKLSTDNPLKDTSQYMFVQNNKTEWVREAIEKNPYNSNQFIWIDFGIFHIINDDELFNKCIYEFKNKSYENIRIGACNFSYAFSIYTHIHWLFLGGIFGGSSNKLIEFADLTKQKCIETIKNQKTIMWETNIWYLIYLENYKLFNPYIADHNKSMLIEY
jgi:hypothetical protein